MIKKLARLVGINGYTFNIEDIILVTPITNVQDMPNSIRKQFKVFLPHNLTLVFSEEVTLEESKDKDHYSHVDLLYDKLSYKTDSFDTLFPEMDAHHCTLNKVSTRVIIRD